MSQKFASNRILANLSASDVRKLRAHLTPVDLALGKILSETGDEYSYAYFPVDCMISLVAETEGADALEVGLVGREGMVGVGIALGVRESPARAIVQAKGTAIRIPAAEFAQAVAGNAALRAEAHRYAYVSMTVAMIIAACNNKHGLESRLARWLLMTRDCLSMTTFEITQVFLGQMLGVRRPSLNATATQLQRRGLINYRRGVLRLLDVEGLRAASCSCYAKIVRLANVKSASGTKK